MRSETKERVIELTERQVEILAVIRRVGTPFSTQRAAHQADMTHDAFREALYRLRAAGAVSWEPKNIRASLMCIDQGRVRVVKAATFEAPRQVVQEAAAVVDVPTPAPPAMAPELRAFIATVYDAAGRALGLRSHEPIVRKGPGE